MKVRCIECERYTFADREMAKQGFGRCKRKSAGDFPSPEFERVCEFYRPAEAERVSEGRAYLEKARKARQEVVNEDKRNAA